MIYQKNYFIFIIVCWMLLLSVSLSGTSASAGRSTSLSIGGSVPLAAYNISASGIGSENADITWLTNGDANSAVSYGTTDSYGSNSTEDARVSSHFVRLEGLITHKIYHYRVISQMSNGLSATSPDANFTTTYSTGTTVATSSEGTTFTGVTATMVAGTQQVNLSSSVSGTPTVSGNTVTVSNPGNGWSSLQYTGTNVIHDGNNISIGGVQGVNLQSAPVTADLGGNIGSVSAQINVALTQLVSGVTIQQNIIQGATASVADAFQLAATNNNLAITSVAYTVEFTNTNSLNANLGADGVTLDLGVDHAWVEANGGRDSIRILRFGEDGIKEVLSTSYTSSTGSTDFFTARSPHGLSTFGMAAVTSSGSSSSGSSSSASSSTGSTSVSSNPGSDSDTGPLGSLFGSPQAVQQSSVPAVAPVVPNPMAPPENAATITRSLSVPGLTVRLDTHRAEMSGAKISLQDTVITISQPGFILTIGTSDTPTTEDGVVSGTVRTVTLSTAPAYIDSGVGMVSVALNTPLAAIPEDATITLSIPQTVNRDMQDAFQSAAQSHNQQVAETAFVVYIRKSNVIATGPATVTLTIPPGWVSNHGGIPSIGIVHLSDDGRSAILRTDYAGSDGQGNMVFTGTSPEGLSAFGLVSLKNLPGTGQVPVETPVSARSSLSPAELIRNLSGGIGTFVLNNIVLVIGGAAVLLVIGTGLILQDRRSRKKNRRIRKKEH